MSIYTCERCMHGFTHASDYLHHRAICVGVLAAPGSEGTWLPAPLQPAPHWAGVEKPVAKQNTPQKSQNINFENIAKSITLTSPILTKTESSPGTSKAEKVKCRFCNKEVDAGHFQSHEATHLLGSPDKPYSCEYCGRTFADVNSCRNHERIHTDPRPFICTLCSKGFMTAGTLKTHLQTHTGEKPFQCTSCDKAFTTAGNLRTHENTHKGEKPFVCLECGKNFSTAGNLRTHEKTHSGLKLFHCDICMKTFTTAGNLKSHAKTHTGEKPFECNQCHKCFTTAGNLKTHYRLHTGERPYVCEICSQAYHSSVHLRSHQKAIHGVEISTGRGRPRTTSLPTPVTNQSTQAPSSNCVTLTNVSLSQSLMSPPMSPRNSDFQFNVWNHSHKIPQIKPPITSYSSHPGFTYSRPMSQQQTPLKRVGLQMLSNHGHKTATTPPTPSSLPSSLTSSSQPQLQVPHNDQSVFPSQMSPHK